MHVREAIRDRRSVKDFETEPVDRETLESLLELSVLVPNHRMTEPLEFRVMGEAAKGAYAEALAGRKTKKIDDPEVARAVREKVVRGHMRVPTMVAVLVRRDENPEIREEDYATAFMAIQNLSLAAVAEGLGTHIKTGAVLGEPELRAALGVAEDQRIASIVFMGRPAAVPEAKPRKAATDLTRWLE
jgi:nitroreductase